MSTTPNTPVRWRYMLAVSAAALAIFLLVTARTGAQSSLGTGSASGKVARSSALDPPCPPSWNPRAPYPIPIMDNAVTSQGGFLYSFGGRTTNFVQTADAYRYNPLADTWTQIAPLPQIRQAASAVSDGTYIYVINGMDSGGHPTNTVFRYDPVSNSYSILPPFTIPTAWQAAVYLNGKIYRIGGADFNITSTVEVYGQGLVAPLPQPLASHMAVAIDGYIYVGGGTPVGNKTYRYDPTNDVWEDDPVPDLPTSYRDAATGVLNGRWILAGGAAAGYYVIGWDPGTGAWQYLTNLSQPLFEVAGATVGDAFYAVGGRHVSDPIQDTEQYYPVGCPTNTPTVTGTPPTWTPTVTQTPTVTPTSTPCYGPNPIQNPGFESGSLPPWVVLDTNPTPVVSTAQAHSGTYSALLGTVSGPEPNGDSSIYQQITVPAEGGTLSFWYLPGSADEIAFDYQDAYVTDLNGTILATILHTNIQYAPWMHQLYNMAAFAGQTVRIEFLVHQDGFGDDTYMYVDDVAILIPGACPTVTPGGPPSATPTSTVASASTPTLTRTPMVTSTSAPSSTSTSPPLSPTAVPSTATSVPASATPTRAAPIPTSSPTSCSLQFADVPPGSTFYAYIRCLACRGIVAGYPCGGPGEPCNGRNDPYFRPGNIVTRGQLAKIVSNSAGFGEPVGGQTFEDVAPGSTFYLYIERLASRDVMSGYPCGSPGEPCDPEGRPYFRPGSTATRGQLTKIVSNAAGFGDPIPSGQQTFADVPSGSTFYIYIERLLMNRPSVMSGYPCGGPREPCDSQHRPYFRPNNDVTRGQNSKIVSNTFFPDCGIAAAR